MEKVVWYISLVYHDSPSLQPGVSGISNIYSLKHYKIIFLEHETHTVPNPTDKSQTLNKPQRLQICKPKPLINIWYCSNLHCHPLMSLHGDSCQSADKFIQRTVLPNSKHAASVISLSCDICVPAWFIWQMMKRKKHKNVEASMWIVSDGIWWLTK